MATKATVGGLRLTMCPLSPCVWGMIDQSGTDPSLCPSVMTSVRPPSHSRLSDGH